jgi:hypothetical protein
MEPQYDRGQAKARLVESRQSPFGEGEIRLIPEDRASSDYLIRIRRRFSRANPP